MNKIGSNMIIKMNPIQFNKMLCFQRLISKWIVIFYICTAKSMTHVIRFKKPNLSEKLKYFDYTMSGILLFIVAFIAMSEMNHKANSLQKAKNRNRELYCDQLFFNQNESRTMQSNITARWYKIVPFIYNVRLIVIVIKINIYKLYQPLWKNCSYLSHLIILFRRFS